MKLPAKPFIVVLISASFSFMGEARAELTIAYPTKENPRFTIVVPDDWNLTPAATAEDYFLITAPSGAELWFRSMEVKSGEEAQAAVQAAMTSGEAWLEEHYRDVEFGETTEGQHEGMSFISLPGKGVYKKTGESVTLTIAFIKMNNGSMAEFWGIVTVGDEEGLTAARAILDSFKAR